jgi:hypothetical protein
MDSLYRNIQEQEYRKRIKLTIICIVRQDGHSIKPEVLDEVDQGHALFRIWWTHSEQMLVSGWIV